MAYVIYYRPAGQSRWVKYGRSICDIYKPVIGLGPMAYDLQVLATNSRGAVTSTIVSFVASADKPPRPAAPTAGVVTSGSIMVNWQPLLVPAIYQLMYRVANVGSYVPFGPPISKGAIALTGLQPRTNYEIRICAINNVGSSLSPVTAVRTPMPTFLDAPTIDNITPYGAMVSWSRR